MNLFLYSNLLTPELNNELAALFDCEGKSMAVIPSQTGPKTEYYFEKLKAVFSPIGITHFKLVSIDTDTPITELRSLLESVDSIFLSGGDTHYLQKHIMQPDIAALIRALADAGKLIIGQSAGAIVLTPTTRTSDLLGDEPSNTSGNYDGLHLSDFEFVPHFEPEKSLATVVAYTEATTRTVIAASENCAVGVKGAEIKLFGDEPNIVVFN